MNIELEKLAHPPAKECEHVRFTFYERGVVCDDCDSRLDELSLARALAQKLIQARSERDLEISRMRADRAYEQIKSGAWFFWAGVALGALTIIAAQMVAGRSL